MRARRRRRRESPRRRMTLRRLTLALLLTLLPIGAAGCWDRQELNELGIISATAVDVTESGRWRISYQLVIPSAISAQGAYVGLSSAPFNVFTTEGESFRGAVSRATQEMSRRLYFGHNQIVVVSEEAARKGISELIEAYMRNGDSRETVMMFVTEGNARKLLEQLLPMEKISGAGIVRLITQEGNHGGNFRQMTVFNVAQDLLGPVRVTGVPGIGLSGSDEPVDSVDAAKKTYTGAKIRLQRLGAFKEGRLVGWLSTHEARGLLWVRGQAKETTVSFSCPDEKLKRNSIRLRRTHARVRPYREGEGWRMRIEESAEGTLLEYNCEGSLDKPQDLERLEERIERELRNDMESGIRASQRLGADLAGFGQALRLSDPRGWKEVEKEWNEQVYPQVRSEFDLHVKIARTGRSNRSYVQAAEDARRKE
ncbi:Ger(x)C family spore germination protein [Paenibacillus albicereus]|uniref:Ger(X)C family spore germination protein n=1 Tax=Paenibacillus albicereus TaxID=2726185 RepID=A0A6H2GY32_9BACL|nr:Ger(x)C family spore germination protein [Paenibacillus albicereus]QJC52341.1 Ger(x)C family spore germination protein [Paenibacillus albicereus]